MITLITTQLVKSRESLNTLELFISKNLLESEIVSSIHVLAEEISAEEAKNLTEKYENLAVKIVRSRPSFRHLIEYALESNIHSELIAFTNADIYFCAEPSDVNILLSLTKKCPELGFTLTRRDDKNIDRLLSIDYPVPEFLSSDAWIFSTRKFKEKQINTTGFESTYLGMLNLENTVNTLFRTAGYQLCNSANIIKAIHLERSTNEYSDFQGNDVLKMASSSQAATINAYLSNSILPIPKNVSLENFIPSKYVAEHIKAASRFIYCDLPSKYNDVAMASLAALTSISQKYNLMIYFASQNNNSKEIDSVMSELSSLFPNLITINANNVKAVILSKRRQSSFVTVSHPGVINEQIIELAVPIYVLSTTAKREVYNWQSFGVNGFIDLIWNGKKIDAWKTKNKDSFFYNKKLQLITCVFNSRNYIDSFLENCSEIAKKCKITHSLIGSKTGKYTLNAVLDYLASGNDGFYVNLIKDPGLYECWNTLIKLSNEEYVSNANPDDLRIDTHAKYLTEMLDLDEKKEILVASSNAFPIYPEYRFNTPVTELAKAVGNGWFSNTPEYYGFESLFRKEVDEHGLMKPNNIPHCAPVWRRTIHEEYGYFKEKRYGSEADFGLWVEYASDGGKFRHYNEKLSGYYIDEQSYGRKKAIPEGRKRVIARYATYLATQESGYLQELSKKFTNNNSKRNDFKINVHSINGYYGDHRFSNNAILESFSKIHSSDAEISFIWFVEKYFIWGGDDGEGKSKTFAPINKPWIGVLHVPPMTPKWAGNQFAQLYDQNEWNLSLKNCKGLICLSNYMTNDLKLIYPKIRHYALKHPISQKASTVERFNFDAFQENPRVILSGYWLRRHKLFYEWDAPMKKIHLLKKYSLNMMNNEYRAFGQTQARKDLESVEQINYLPNNEYDALLQTSILFLYMYDTSANNAVIECILHATPFISNRHPAIEEYAGKEYPLFVEEDELNGLTIGEILSLSEQAHEYLKLREKAIDLSLGTFANSVIEIARKA